MTSSKINSENYDRWSESYDSYPNPTVAIDEMSLPAKYANWSNLKVLEIGCGTGRHTVRLESQSNTVTGIDISEGMLSKAKSKLPNVEFINANFIEHDFGTHKFDRILMSLVLEHIDDLDQFFKKVFKLLNANGEILFSEIHPLRAEAGSLAHFKNEDNEEIWLSSTAQTGDEIRTEASSAGLELILSEDILGNKEHAELNPKWTKYIDKPMIQIWSFRRT